METLRTDAFAAEAWGVSQWLSVDAYWTRSE